MKRLVLHSLSAVVLTASLTLAYLFGAKQGYEKAYVDGYKHGESVALMSIPHVELGENESFYLGVYATCLSYNRELYQVAHDMSIIMCRRGVSWAYRNDWFKTYDLAGFLWPMTKETSQ